MSWKNWGDHPVVVGIGILSAVAGIASMIVTNTYDRSGTVSNTGNGNQIVGNNNTISQGQRDIINLPCFNGGGSGGWMFESGTPNEYYPITILKVQEWPLRSYPDHPQYKPDSKFAKYGTCAIIPSGNPQ